MAVFSYVAKDDTGATIEGDVTAATELEAARIIRAEGKFVVRIAPRGKIKKKAGGSTGSGRRAVFGDRLNPDDIIFFTTQMAVMIDTGVALADALEACVHDGNSVRFAQALDSVRDLVQGGMEFSTAMSEHPTVFPPLYVSLIKASEATGQLSPILDRLALHLKDQRETKKKIRGAITYPIVMLVFALGVTVFLVSFVLPKFSEIYGGREQDLPVMTRLLLEFSDSFVAYGPYIAGLVLLACAAVVYYAKTPGGRNRADYLKLKLPIFGPLFHKAYLARSFRTLGTMIHSGVSMLEGVRLTTRVCGNLVYENLWKVVNERVEGGQQISEALADQKVVPKSILKMLNAGERGGKLGLVMERVADFCESELNVTIKTLTGLIEPAIIMVLGVIVGSLVIALLLPIFTISRVL